MNRLLLLLGTAAGATLPWLIDSTVKSVIILLAAGATTLLFREASAAKRHLLWFIAIAASLALPVLSIVLPSWRILPAWSGLIGHPPTMADITSNTPRAPDSARKAFVPEVTATTPSTSIPQRNQHAGVASSISTWPALSLVWAAGCAMLLLRLCAAHFVLCAALKRCTPVTDELVLGELQTGRMQLGVRRSMMVLRDPQQTIPFVSGWLRPRLVLPAESKHWNTTRLRSVVLHELAHVKRNDIALEWLTQIVCAVHWFNPLVWFAAWRLRLERERACDDLVLANGVRAADYAEHLLHVATKFEAPIATYSGGTALAMARPSRLEGRLVALLNDHSNRAAVTRPLAIAAVCLTLAMIVPIAMLRAADEKPANATGNAAADAGSPPAAETVVPKNIDAPPVSKETKDNDAGVAGETSAGSRSKANADGIRVLRTELDALRQKFSDDHPRVRELRARIAQLEDVKNVQAATDPLIPRATDGESTREALAQLRLQQAELDYRRAAELHQQKLMSAAEYEKAKALLTLRRAELRGDQTEVARVEVAQAEAEFARVSELRRQNLISQAENEQAKLALEAARLRLKQRELEAIDANRAEEKSARTVSKIPVLADIPVLGRLFRNEHEVAAAAEREAAVARAAEQSQIAHNGSGSPRKSEMRVVALKYCEASIVSPLVEKAMNVQKQSVHVLSDARTNSLVVVGDGGAIDAAIRFIAGLDTPSSDAIESEAKRNAQAPRNLQQALAAQQQIVEAARAALQEAEAQLHRLKKQEGAQGERP